MLLGIAVLLLVIWAAGFFLASLGAIIHVLLVVAIVVALGHFLRGAGRRTAV